MINASGVVLYVGKAKNLKNRVSQYFQSPQDRKTTQMLSCVADFEVTVTRTETEAYLLESNLIKQYQPKYNVIFKDDKSYPYIFISTHAAFPQIRSYRGERRLKGAYFGPYPTGKKVRETIDFLQRSFLLRTCSETFFKNRSRPCLQYQIKRCSAPCVGLISEGDYRFDLEHAKAVLEGRSEKVIHQLEKSMALASAQLHYEKAALFRDRIAMLRQMQSDQSVSHFKTSQKIDVFAVHGIENLVGIQLLQIRENQIVGSRQYFSKIDHALDRDDTDVLMAFLLQYYSALETDLKPEAILCSQWPKAMASFSKALKSYLGSKTKFIRTPKGIKKKWLEMAIQSVQEALVARKQPSDFIATGFRELSTYLKVQKPLEKIICFDVSHFQGEATVGGSVVFSPKGACFSQYRLFKIKTAKPGDDLGALKEAISRFLSHLEQPDRDRSLCFLIDGGRGQLKVAEELVFKSDLKNSILLSIAKGENRKVGLETFFKSSTGAVLNLPDACPARHVLEQIRDSAHTFARSGHIKVRKKTRFRSELEAIPGIGKKRRLNLLKFFGGLDSLKQASSEEIEKVPSISRALAEKIYAHLHRG